MEWNLQVMEKSWLIEERKRTWWLARPVWKRTVNMVGLPGQYLREHAIGLPGQGTYVSY